MMGERKTRNTLDIEVNVDTDEAHERIERLAKATERCTKAFEELGDAIVNVGALMSSSNGEAVSRGEFIEIMMKGK